jgi:hypothetical protein
MTLNPRELGRRALGAAAIAATLLIAACGGGDTETNNFRASRVVVFGDESSVIVDTNGDANGSKYSVNATVSETDPTVACALNPLWVQSVASLYGLVFPECNNAVPRSSRRPAGCAPPSARAPPTSPGRSTPSRPKAARRRRSGDRPDRRQRRPRRISELPGADRGPADRQGRG